MLVITPDDVKKLMKPTDGFLCKLNANTYGIDFHSFSITDYNSKHILFAVGKDIPPTQDITIDFNMENSYSEDMMRKIKYTFSEDVLRLPNIQTKLIFKVGDNELRDFRMIERHYFKDKLVKSFEFTFGFCIPGSENCWETIYDIPSLPEELINAMIDSPYETVSDSFYFVDGKLIMHNKASYKYIREDKAQAKKSYEDKYSAKSFKAFKAAKDASSVARQTLEVDEASIADAKTILDNMRLNDAKGSKEPQWSKDSDYN